MPEDRLGALIEHHLLFRQESTAGVFTTFYRFGPGEHDEQCVVVSTANCRDCVVGYLSEVLERFTAH